MNETLLNWLFAPDPAQAAQTRVLLDSERRPEEHTYIPLVRSLRETFGTDFVQVYRRLRFYRQLALQGRISG